MNPPGSYTALEDLGRVRLSRHKGLLLREGDEPAEAAPERAARYADFPAFRGIDYPAVPGTRS